MRELSLNILDIAENSVKAGATLIGISIRVKQGLIEIQINDNGSGMDEQFLAKVTDPFTTTRNTRKVGMGIPLFKMAAEMSGGSFKIESREKVGTTVTARFQKDNIDTPPLGSLEDSLIALIAANCIIDYVFVYSVEDKEFVLDTREIKKMLDGIPLDEAEVLSYMKQMVKENIVSINGGMIL